MNMEPEPESSLAVSFLDTLSCGLGGAIALFMIFVTMPQHGVMPTGEVDLTQGSATEIRQTGIVFPADDRIVENATMKLVLTFTNIDQWNLSDSSPIDWLQNNVSTSGIRPVGRHSGGVPQTPPIEVNNSVMLRFFISGGQNPRSKIRIHIPAVEFDREGTFQIQMAGLSVASVHGTIPADSPEEFTVDVTAEMPIQSSHITEAPIPEEVFPP